MRLPCLSNVLQGACFLAASLFLSSYLCKSSDDETHVKVLNDDGDATGALAKTKSSTKDVIFVSTLDGKITALDAANDGALLWTKDTGPGSLLSSTISNIKITYNDQSIRLVPSLNGGLYKFDGETIEAFPVTAEALLSNSVKLSDESIVTGGSEISSYGIGATTGQLKYACEMSSCRKFNEDDKNLEENMVIVKRHTQTVRAIDPFSGSEKWNFSIGRHDITSVKACQTTSSLDDADDDDVTIVNADDCTPPVDNPDKGDVFSDIEVKFIVPEGIVCAVDRKDPRRVIWKKKLDSPVVNAWIKSARSSNVLPVDLFDENNIPALHPIGDDDDSKTSLRPFMYIGIYKKQLYIQESHYKHKPNVKMISNGEERSVNALQLTWKPYSASAPWLTQIMDSHQRAKLLLAGSNVAPTSALAVKDDACDIVSPEDGFYVFMDKSELTDDSLVCMSDNTTVVEEPFEHIVIVSLWHWWKEVLAISIVTSLTIHFLVTRRAIRKIKARLLSESSSAMASSLQSETKSSKSKSIESSATNKSLDKLDISTTSGYISRYTTDFEQVQCLGRGGFGVVFEAKNTIDDCRYAVKRIVLPNSKDAREKVMREVKALAKLDHPGIVRYFNAWLESPPPGWQENRDLEWMDSEALCPTPANSVATNNNNEMKVGDRTGSFDFGCQNRSNDSSSFDIIFEHSRKFGDDDASGKLIPGDDAGNAVDDSTESSVSGFCFDPWKGNFDIDENRPKNDSESVFTFEKDSGCDETKDDEDDNLSSNRPDNLVLHKHKLFLYIQMQLCKKETLKDWLNANNGPRTTLQVLDIYDQILSAVQYVHDEVGLMHRDLKPSNIFFSMDGLIKIGDFGLVTAMAENQIEADHTPVHEGNSNGSKFIDQRHTDQVGTQLYMSPEQVAGRPYNHKIDIFSLGLILFELLVSFNTQMERLQIMSDMKKQMFPIDFQRERHRECLLLKNVLHRDPDLRPEAEEIKRRLHEMYDDLRLITESRRTNSSTSSNDDSFVELNQQSATTLKRVN